jgi:hypothetical protein
LVMVKSRTSSCPPITWGWGLSSLWSSDIHCVSAAVTFRRRSQTVACSCHDLSRIINSLLDFLWNLSPWSVAEGDTGKKNRRKTKLDLEFCFDFALQVRYVVAFYCLMSVFKGGSHLPGNHGFSSLVTGK